MARCRSRRTAGRGGAPRSSVRTASICRPGRGGDLVLQPAELVGDRGGDDVAAGGQHLAELDERDAGLIQGQRAVIGPARPGRRRPRGRAAAAADVRAEAVPDRDPEDLHVPLGPGDPAGEVAAQIAGPGQRAGRDEGLAEDQEDEAGQHRAQRGQDEQRHRGAVRALERRRTDQPLGDRIEQGEREPGPESQSDQAEPYPEQALCHGYEDHHENGDVDQAEDHDVHGLNSRCCGGAGGTPLRWSRP